MDITNGGFSLEILKILQEVSESHFIAFDLEFSGVASWRPAGAGKSSKLSLQELYDDVKAAAEKYQILQVGLTIVKEDLSKGRYLARPYNFNISPLTSLRERHFGREWSYHSGAVSFLTRNGFKFDLPITQGVQYLSRSEEKIARQNITQDEESRSKIADMDLKPEDEALINHIRSSVKQWQSQPKDQQEEFLNIPGEAPEIPQLLSRYQIRLTHQIVRSEYPNLKTNGRGHFVQISNPTEQQQASHRLVQVQEREKDIAKAIGFRWLIDGIISGNITNMPDDYMMGGLLGIKLHGKSPKDFIEDLQQKLKARPRVLVGHNCFTDLVNLYKCFIGPLPASVERFASEIHDLFPGVIDTKNLASFGHKRWGNTSLEDVEMDLRTEPTPRIDVPAEFDRYLYSSSYHEAGFDSLLTAKIAIKLSAKLNREQEYLQKVEQSKNADQNIPAFGVDDDDGYETAEESVVSDGGLVRTISRTLSAPVNALKSLVGHKASGSNISTQHSAKSNMVQEKSQEVARSWPQQDGVKWIKNDLERTEINEYLEEDAADAEAVPQNDATGFGGSVGDGVGLVLEETKASEKGEMMPKWDNRPFWSLFGNKLQVNGSKEGVCKLE